jgi:small GTP-binding protein
MDLLMKLSQWVKVKITSENNDNTNYLEYKILRLGDKAVGKSSICNRFCLSEFSLEIKPSQNCECYVKTVKLFDQYIKLYLIDTVETILSNDRYELYSDVKGAIIMYDITKAVSFEKLDKWLLDVKQRINPQLPILITGHKKDLTFLRNVDYEEGKEKSIKNFCSFTETSCIDDDSVDIAIKTIVAKIYFNDMPETKKQYFRMAIKDEIKEEPEEKERSLSINSQKIEVVDKEKKIS